MFLLVLAPAALAVPALFEQRPDGFAARFGSQRALFHRDAISVRDHHGPVVDISFPGSTSGDWLPLEPSGETISYFIGADPSRWIRNAPRFRKLTRRNLYPGIDVVFHSEAGPLEYDLILHPGASYQQIRLRFTGANARLGTDGRIEAGPLRQRPPFLYQTAGAQRHAVEGRFVPAGANEFRLELGPYDKALPLVIDPVLESASYYGGEGDDRIVAAGRDFTVGSTTSVAVPGAFSRRTSRDIFVRIANQTVVFGGSGDDEVTAATQDGSSIVIAGFTRSSDFPLSNFGFDTLKPRGGNDAFVADVSGGSFRVVPIAGAGDDRALAITNYAGGYLVVGGTTDSPDLPAKDALQPRPGGGRDGFLAVLRTFELVSLSYWGGAGDDGIAAAASAFDRRSVLIAGETRSADFPANTGAHRGNSDAFLSEFEIGDGILKHAGSRRIGGSGEDRIEALAYRAISGDLAIAGTTNSTDFPVRNATQTAAGGNTDAFLMRLTSPDLEVAFATYAGGSGPDEGTAVAWSGLGDLYLAGNTRSTDLPVAGPLQPRPGGRLDGFFALVDSNNRLRHLTYYGGSGDDRVLWVTADRTSALIAGETDSADLPVTASSRDSGQDGFLAVIGTDYIAGPDTLVIGKDMRVSAGFEAGLAGERTWTVRSADPGRLLVNAGLPEVVRAGGSSIALAVESLAETGESELVVSATGLPDKRVRVRFLPSALVVSLPLKVTMELAAPRRFIQVRIGAFDPETRRVVAYGARRSGLPLARRQWSSSNESVARVIPENDTLVAAGPGTAVVTLASPDLPVLPSESTEVTVERSRIVPLPQILLGKDLVAALHLVTTRGVVVFGPDIPLPVTLRSSDPDRLLISSRDTPLGAASITLSGRVLPQTGRAVGVVGLADSGEAEVIVTSEAFEDARVQVRLARTEALMETPSNTRILTRGVSSLLSIVLRPEGSSAGIGTYSFRMDGADSPILVDSSDLAVLVPGSVPTLRNLRPVVLQAFREGTADLRLSLRDRTDFLIGPPLSLTVEPNRITVPDVYVGRNLQTRVPLRSPVPLPEATFTIDNESLALVSAFADSPGGKQATTRIGGVYVQGLASGRTTLRASVPGYPSVQSTVTIAPSGFAFVEDRLNLALFGSPPAQVRIRPFALDEQSGIPIEEQEMRPGVQARVALRTQGSSVAIQPAAIDAHTQLTSVSLSIREAGDTLISIDSPPGFTMPSRRARLPVRVSPEFNIQTPVAAIKDAVTMLDLTSGIEITATSGDPSRLLLSNNGVDGGSASVRFTGRLYLYGLAPSGSAQVRLQAQGSSATIDVPLQTMVVNVGIYPFPEFITGSQPVRYSAGLYSTGFPSVPFSPRRESGPIRVQLASSNSRVASVRPEQIEFTEGRQNRTFEVTPAVVGEADIRFSSSVTVQPAAMRVTVRSPRLLPVEPFVLGKDTQAPGTLRFADTPASAMTFTITSSAPDRVRVSTSQSNDGAASAAISVPAGSTFSVPFWVQALDGQGEAQLRISSAGFADQVVPVRLTPATFVIRDGQPGTPLTDFKHYAVELRPTGLLLRPGVAVTIPIRVENPEVATPDPSELVMLGGSARTFTLRAGSAGRTRVIIEPPAEWASASLAERSLEVETIRGAAGSCGSTALGKDAQLLCGFRGLVTGPVIVRSTDPSRVALSSSVATVSTAGELTLQPIEGRVSFTAQGLASEGTADIVITPPDVPEISIRVQCAPSTFVWTTPRLTMSTGERTAINLWLSLAPPAPAGQLLPRTALRVGITSSDPEIVKVEGDAVLGFFPGPGPFATALKPGTVTLRMTPPPGFAPPPVETMQITVVP